MSRSHIAGFSYLDENKYIFVLLNSFELLQILKVPKVCAWVYVSFLCQRNLFSLNVGKVDVSMKWICETSFEFLIFLSFHFLLPSIALNGHLSQNCGKLNKGYQEGGKRKWIQLLTNIYTPKGITTTATRRSAIANETIK